MTNPTLLLAALLLAPTLASAQDLLVDFNSTNQDGGPHNQAGYQPYDAAHESAGDFTAARNYTAFGTTVSLTTSFPDSSDNRVQQMIDRGAGNDANWTGQKLDLLTDWIGVDTRTGNGGNGDYDGVTGNPTRLLLTLSGLPAGNYNWRSYHHDTEHIFTDFQVEVSTDGGTSFSAPTTYTGTDSTPGGNPDSGAVENGAGNQDPATLPSTTDLDFTATGADVAVRLTPLSQTAVHSQFLVLNGFELTSTSPATGPTDITLTATTFSKTAPVGTTVGALSSTDPTPGDTFTYTLVPGGGDSGNTFFDITGANLITDFDFSAVPGATQYSIRVQSTDALGAAFQKTFTLTLESDSDNDGLDDDWELTYFPDLETATGSGNNDTDTLTNAQEEEAGTDPTKADTDGDNLDDADEIARGTNPLLADSDGDTIDDGDEVAGTNGHVTDPTKADSDGDGFNDNIEIAENTDPNNDADFPNTALALVINEFLADNQNGLTDGFGNREDWIEIFNPNATPINLDAYHLTDNPDSLDKWSFPPVTIPAGGYLVVFASGLDLTDGAGNAHTDFSLAANGEYLAIVRPDGTTIDDAFAPEFPNQFPDISFGKHPTDNSLRYFSTPTPGAANSATNFIDVVRDTKFSVDRGHYTAPFDVEITTATEGATIRYTTDGSKPSETVGSVYTGTVPITTTTVLRAIAYKPGALSTNVDAHTYLFADDIANQPADPPGWPTTWGIHENRDQPADYEMDPRVVNDTLGIAEHTIQQALTDIPSVSISLPTSEFISEPRGIYNNAQDRRETECSFEFIPTDGSNGIQANCKIEMHGNASRRPTRMHKHSMRLTFTSDLGPGKLRYPLFPQSNVDEFNKLVLRACFTDSWAVVQWGGSNRYRPNDSMYLRDVWMKDSMRDMGHVSGNGDFVHLYVNGLYFGLHDLTERLEDDFYADHLGGNVEDWEVNADMGSPGALWNAMMSAVNAAGSTVAGYENVKTRLDVENYIDYMLLHFYADAEDWPTKNGYAAANAASGDGRYRFQVWDQEISLDKFSWNRYGTSAGSAAPWARLKSNPEFLMQFADRVHKHMFNGGALSPQASIDRFLALCTEIDKAIMAESARWGDIQETVPYATRPGSSNDPDGDFYPPNNDGYFTREKHWILERDNVVGHYIPTLHDESDSRSIIRELRSQRLYPSIDAPVFSRHGGPVPRGFELAFNASDTVYYTTDGSDPRNPGGSQNAAANSISPSGTTTVQTELVGLNPANPTTLTHLVPTADLALAWTAHDFDDSAWSTAPANSLGVGYERSGSDYTPAIDADVRDTLLDTHPTIYIRHEFDVTGAADYTSLSLGMQYDDGFVAYLNGQRIGAANDPDPLTWESGSAGSHEASDLNTFDSIATINLTANPSFLREGTNVLAIHGLNDGQGSSDFLIAPQLTATKTVNSEGSGITIDNSTPVLARARTAGGEWFALTQAYFSTNDLAVTEIMYRPATNSRAEFIELTNTGTGTVSLEGLHFTQGIDFAFSGSAVTALAPNARLLIVRETAAFQSVYGNAHDALIAGEFQNGTALSNDGETITLSDSAGNVILTFKYNDASDWPQSPDGGGDSLVLIDPAGDLDDPTNWRPSSAANGNPGTTDTAPYTGDPADTAAFFTHAFGPTPAPLTTAIDETGNLLITFTRNLTADDIAHTIETSTDGLTSWQPATGTTLTTRQTLPGGQESLTYSLTSPLPTLFTRVRATSR